MKICRERAHTRPRSENRQPDVRTPHFARSARKVSSFKEPSIKGAASSWYLLLVTFLLRAPRAHLPPRLRPRMDRELALPGACRRYGFVMRYRSATVAGLHGLPCVCRVDEKNFRYLLTTGCPPPAGNIKICAHLAFHRLLVHKPKSGPDLLVTTQARCCNIHINAS